MMKNCKDQKWSDVDETCSDHVSEGPTKGW